MSGAEQVKTQSSDFAPSARRGGFRAGSAVTSCVEAAHKTCCRAICVLQQPCGSVIAREQARFAAPLRRTVAVRHLAPNRNAARILAVLTEPFRSICSAAAQTCNSLGL